MHIIVVGPHVLMKCDEIIVHSSCPLTLYIKTTSEGDLLSIQIGSMCVYGYG